jgi:hypothetical protein
MRTLVQRCLMAWVLALLAACAASPDNPRLGDASQPQLQAQIAQASRALAPGQPPRVVFAGFALHSESKAFRGDVQLAEQVMRAIDPQAVLFHLSNPTVGQDADWPFASAENVSAVMQAIGKLARPVDKVVVLFATHGGRQVLAIKVANQDVTVLTPTHLQQWLAPLRDKPTLLVLSACYSGSFIPSLRAPTRIILTAASADRNSFGCNFHSSNTFFIEELLRQDAIQDRSLLQLMEQARAGVLRREQALKILPSQPQSFVGAGVEGWARQPLAQWLRTIAP